MKKFMMLAACAATFYACSSNDVNTPDIDENTTGLLSVSTSVLTQNSKGTKTIGSRATKANGVATGPVMDAALASGSKIGVFVFNNNNNFEGYTGATNSGTNPALNQLWIATENPAYTKSGDFTLGIQPAKVYAYFPYQENVSANTTTKHPELNITPGYTDYLYGAHGTMNNDGTITASTVNSTNTGAAIQLNHALAMISFTFTRGTGYPKDEACQVNAITIEKLADNATMSVVDGITAPTQFISGSTQLGVKGFYNSTYIEPATEITGWTNNRFNFKPDGQNKDNLVNNILGSVSTTTGDQAKAPLFHALVLPNTDMPEDVTEGNLHAVIKIDGVQYKIALAIGKRLPGTTSTEANEWAANKHYTYNLTISGKSGQGSTLEVTSVTVRQWTAGGSSDVEI